MKKVLSIGAIILLIIVLHKAAPTAQAACNWTYNTSTFPVTAVTCGIDASSSEMYDYSAGADDTTNGYVVSIPNGVTVTVNAGTSLAPTKLNVGSFQLGSTGQLAVSANYIAVTVGSKCYVVDADGDGYSPTPTTCSLTGGAGYIRRNKLTGTGVDCADTGANANLANPGQVTAQAGTFTNAVNPTLTHDWNCNGTETQTYATATYSCAACTNSGGYASTINTTNGYSGSVPGCGASGTYYTITNATCQNPAVASCTGAYTTSTVTQTCL